MTDVKRLSEAFKADQTLRSFQNRPNDSEIVNMAKSLSPVTTPKPVGLFGSGFAAHQKETARSLSEMAKSLQQQQVPDLLLRDPMHAVREVTNARHRREREHDEAMDDIRRDISNLAKNSLSHNDNLSKLVDVTISHNDRITENNELIKEVHVTNVVKTADHTSNAKKIGDYLQNKALDLITIVLLIVLCAIMAGKKPEQVMASKANEYIQTQIAPKK